MGPKNSGCSRSRASSSGNSHRQTGSFWKPVDNIVMIASASVSSARTIFAGCDCMLSPPVNNSRNGSADVTPAMPHGRLRYDIHARFGAGRCASASADSRGTVVDSVLIAGHAGTAVAVSGPAWKSASWRDQRCCALAGGKRGSELAAGADAELGEDFPQVVGDGGGADKQLRGDLRVGGAVAGQAGDQRFLRGQRIWRLGRLLPGVPAGRPQLDARPLGERRGADRVEDLIRAAELIAGVAPAPLAAQPLAVQEAGASQIHPQASAAEAVDRLAVVALGGVPVADQRPRAGLGTQRPVGPAGAGQAGEPLQRAGRALGYPAAHRRLHQLDKSPVREPDRWGVLAGPLRRGQRLLIAAQAVAQNRVRPLHGTQPSPLTPAPYVVGGGLDQLSGVCFL